jgi:hypothetical protein
LHNPDEEPECEEPIDWAFDDFKLSKEKLRELIHREALRFHPD